MPTRRVGLSMRDHYQLRRLAEQNRFYGPKTDMRSLANRGLIASTGQTDERGRTEWIITEAGRAALATAKP